MRLINAEALKASMMLDGLTMMLSGEKYELTDAMKTVDHAPTIEMERKTGRWTETCEFHGDTNVVSHKALACSVCNVAFIGGYGYGIKEMLEDFRYCPNCGAKMEEENHVQDISQ